MNFMHLLIFYSIHLKVFWKRKEEETLSNFCRNFNLHQHTHSRKVHEIRRTRSLVNKALSIKFAVDVFLPGEARRKHTNTIFLSIPIAVFLFALKIDNNETQYLHKNIIIGEGRKTKVLKKTRVSHFQITQQKVCTQHRSRVCLKPKGYLIWQTIWWR